MNTELNSNPTRLASSPRPWCAVLTLSPGTPSPRLDNPINKLGHSLCRPTSQRTRVQTPSSSHSCALGRDTWVSALICKAGVPEQHWTAGLTVHVNHLNQRCACNKDSKGKLLSLFSPKTGVTCLCHLALHCFSSSFTQPSCAFILYLLKQGQGQIPLGTWALP